MQLQSRAPEHFSTPFFSSPSSSVAYESGCSLDALERLVHFTGAGADACLYAVHPPQAKGTDSAALTPTTEGLRYWLNPSVRARPTTATCEITNLGPPFFASTSTAVLRISATPLFVDGRCFPTRCVVSLATSAQRLDGVSLRPVVVTEWNLTASGAAGVCTTTVPLRTLYHLAVLISSSAPATGVEEVRLYLHLRFMGCSDGSDTHRIAAVRLRYEQLGTAAEVLPQLLQRRQRAAAHVMLPSPYDVKYHSEGRFTRAGAPLEEVEVGVIAGSSTATSSGRKDMGDDAGKSLFVGAKERRTHTSPPSSTRMRSDGCEDAAAESAAAVAASPPRRSATRPRAERLLSADRDSSSRIEAVGVTEGRDGPKLVCVDRALRIPPPPPKLSAAAGSAPSLLSGPWPPRKVRTIVLAPSISPSLCSSSAGTSPRGSPSPLPSPPPTTNADSSAKAHSNTSLAGTARCREAESCDREGFEDAVDALMPLTQQNVQGRFLEPTKPDERTSSPVSDAGTSSQRRHCHESSSVPRHIPSAEAQEVSQAVAESCPDPHLHPFAPQQLYAHSDPAVLWAATSLLGTLPWTLASQHQSRISTPAVSVASSRAPSCDGSAQAMSTDSAKGAPCWQMRQLTPSKSFLDSGSCAHRRDTRETQQRSWKRTPLGALDPNTSFHRPERTTVTAKADLAAMTRTFSTESTTAFLQHWRRNESAHASPQLHPPHPFATASPSTSHPKPFSRPSFPQPATTYAPLQRPTSAFVPRLLLRSRQRSNETRAASSTQRGGGVITTNRSRSIGSSSATTATAASAPPPSQNRSLWSKAAAPSGASSSLDARPRRSATADVHERRRLSTAASPMSSSAVLSVMSSSWLQSNATVTPKTPSESAAEMKSQSSTASQRSFRSSTAPPSSHRPQHVPSPTGAAATERMEDAVSVASGSSAPLPPSPLPPPEGCALFHSPAPTHSSRSSSPSSSSSRACAAPVLPLQEAHDGNRNRNRPRQRSITQSGSGHGSNNSSAFRQFVVQTFAVWKHHASRRGVGRRWLRIERLPPSPSTSAAARFRITLDKAHPPVLARASMLLGRSSSSSGNNSDHAANPSCEVCIRRTDTVEVWCGLRAYHSGVIHQRKVHRAECCLVIRCNAQLVTAVELESTEAVDTVRRLLSDRRCTPHAKM
ncbi:conserved hypothetical protein [Leishmania major strain Friedlin]|uniref:PH-like domain-containing protein n=1 Tax=Leishmania major TaxID=5664 RepID=Q4Q163_LEIMA|nr:conserved hypothetical protein [Leishmania major strain Friedlin]CAG9583896.1 hypothetical_protein_-_conserved [Leishmania major strain Friedlin]CAJ09318.1 conserved hypothetical protein [Leishmania major strain Friedlin]|eukprot:XP_001686935.1 conserved hypothetical protein [Leishmania major strain Friedlin]